jgi:hypothetical protein
MSPQLKTALIRGLIFAPLAGLLAFLTGLQQGQSLKVAAIAGGVQLVGNLIWRVGVEGGIDTQAAKPAPPG